MLVSILAIPVMLVIERFILPEDRYRLWRLAAHKKTSFLFKIARIKINVRSRVPDYDFPVIYVSNHPSILDGFIYFYILGPDLIALTAPFESFAFPFNIWFKKMGAIDVQRDDYDERHHPEANEKKMAMHKVIGTLEQHKSVLIFPEGHYERTNKLHYLHSGAARLAIQAKVPVIPMSLIGIEKVQIDKFRARPGTVTVRFNGVMHPPKLSKNEPYRKASKEFADQIAREIISLLPVRYLPDYIDDYEPDTIGAFIDIDNTIYKGYSQQDFVKYLFKNKKLNPWLAFKIFYWVFLEKTHLLPHKQLMNLSLSLLEGWDVAEIDKLCKDFFDKNIFERIQTHMLPIIKDHQEQGHIIVLVTEVIHPLARQFSEHFKAAATLDTVLEQRKGVYTGDVERLAYREKKADLVKEFAADFNIDLKRSYVYADSVSDIPMFELVKHKTAVHPDPELKREAQGRGWSILS